MGRMKEWWMDQIETICERYARDRRMGQDEKEAFERSLQELTLHGLDMEEATAQLEAAWFDSPA
ncbi:MAG: hypothetical protein JWP44_5079 [Mucilaginibacter sp.]|nr:hypothetical protein [Mucilaginibacter sp.]